MYAALRPLVIAAALVLPSLASAQALPPCLERFSSNGWDVQAMIGAAGDLYALRGTGTAEGAEGGATGIAAPELGIIAYPQDEIRRFVVRFPSFTLGGDHYSNDGADDAVDEGNVMAQLKIAGAGGSKLLDPPEDGAPDPVTRWEFDWEPLGKDFLEGAADLKGELLLNGRAVLSFGFDVSGLDAAIAAAVKAHDDLEAQLSAGQCEA